MERRILVIGSANIDFVCNTSCIPTAGETLVTEGAYTFVPGGKGANAAIAASRLGGEAVFCTRVGDDAYGDRLLRIYAENHIDTRFVKVDEASQTGLAVVMVESDGTNRIIVYPGANKNISESDIENALLVSPDIVVTNLEISNESVEYLSKLCAVKQIPLVLDCGGVGKDFKLDKIKKLEILSPNENETELLTGIRPNCLDNCLKACMKLCSMADIKFVVLKLGSRGSYIYDGKYCSICGPYDVDAVDTTAAGDAFTAAIALAYSQNGNDIAEACKFGNAVGAMTVTKPGAIPSIPFAKDVEEFMKNNSQI